MDTMACQSQLQIVETTSEHMREEKQKLQNILMQSREHKARLEKDLEQKTNRLMTANNLHSKLGETNQLVKSKLEHTQVI